MNCSNARISLDINKNGSGAVVYAKRGDVGRRIYIVLTDGCIPYHIAGDCTAVFTAKKPDNNVLYNDCSIQGDTIIYDMTEQTTSVVGRLMCEVKLYGGDGKLLTSPKFTLIVSATVYDEGDEVESTREFSALTAAMTELAELKKKGLKGDEGDSAYEVAKTTGFEGTEEEWLKSLVGPKGDKGEKGEKGEAADAVQYVAQPLTEKQQMQARQNMGLYGDVDVEIGETLFWDGDAAGKDVADKWDGGQTILLSEGVIEDAMYTGTLNMDGEAMEVSIIQDADMPRVHAILDEEGHEYGFIAEMGILALLYYKGAEVRKSGLYVHTDMIPGGAIITIPGYAFVEKVPVQMPEKYIPRTVPIVGSAMVGQAVAVKAVDENGVPIAWKVVDFPVSGGGGLNITDDGNGNVTIASTGSVTITDDGEGNVTIV